MPLPCPIGHAFLLFPATPIMPPVAISKQMGHMLLRAGRLGSLVEERWAVYFWTDWWDLKEVAGVGGWVGFSQGIIF